MDRKSLPYRLIFVTFCVLLAGIFTGIFAQSLGERFVAGELLVKFNNGHGVNAARIAHRAVGSAVLEDLGDSKWQRVQLPVGMSIDKAIELYNRLEGVEFAQPNFYYHLQLTPNDAQFNAAGMYGLTKISAPSAWDLSTGSSAVVVANIDTGMRMTHEDLLPNLWVNPGEIPANSIDDDGNGFIDDVNGMDFFYNDSNPADEHGHGTHTGGTIGAAGNNFVGVTGVNWSVKIMPIKIYNNTGFGSTSAMLVNAYNYVRMMKLRGVNIRVTNNSYGGCDEACGYDQATKDGIDAMGAVGILNVFAAGNDGRNTDTLPAYPASYTSPSIISVANSTSTDTRNSSSNIGLVTVDLAAPGSVILSTTFGSNSSYGAMTGTSMASPHVAGAAALLSAYNPSLSVASLKATLLNTVDPLAPWAPLVKTGGRLNVDRALRNQSVCTFTNAGGSMNVPTKGGVFSINITSGQNCDYQVKSLSPWIKVMSGDALSGNGTVIFRVPVNPTISRTGSISIAGQSFTVVQSRN
ncbi:MAG: S8 family serine peptidase [Pyrinomonadaceae bacterium]|nr:S8 family serine peptidase [Acidobacteriota bacterium]MBK7933456.1 S8 family serine peptidase [Acidobacteriota bacterium]MBP7375632.1 S8 family serine peptidase [Pyrinomonadaceae bacterium]